MRNIRLLIEYEGTNYSGWQAQRGLPTVQGTLIQAIKELTGAEAELQGASRTDAGVHASGQVANFLSGTNITTLGIRNGLNHLLPDDIVIKDAAEVPPEFDSRRKSQGKTYIYRIINRPYPSALLRNFAWFVFKPLNVELMREATEYIIGEKDFASFRAADSDSLTSIREVTSIRIEEKEEGLIEIEVKGTAFLRHMVRIMVGTLAAVGKGKLKPTDVGLIIEAKDRRKASMTAPPQGLLLKEVLY